MKLLLIRHGDPDYEHDCLTERGKREAACLAERMEALPVRDYYVSPLGRARETASFTLERTGRRAETCEWLREFAPKIERPHDADGPVHIAWDWLPADWLPCRDFLDVEDWGNHPRMQRGHVGEEYDWVAKSLDRLLAEHGYLREGRYYRVLEPNNDSLAFFCHFGVSCVLLSHLLSVSPMVLWHGLAMAPTSVTTLVTEERREGIASFRATGIGDVSHLYAAGLEPSFSARFCECFGNTQERHD